MLSARLNAAALNNSRISVAGRMKLRKQENIEESRLIIYLRMIDLSICILDRHRYVKLLTAGVAECRRGIGGGTSFPVSGGSGSKEALAGRATL